MLSLLTFALLTGCGATSSISPTLTSSSTKSAISAKSIKIEAQTIAIQTYNSFMEVMSSDDDKDTIYAAYLVLKDGLKKIKSLPGDDAESKSIRALAEETLQEMKKYYDGPSNIASLSEEELTNFLMAESVAVGGLAQIGAFH